MPNETNDQPSPSPAPRPKRGRPATGKTKVKLSASVNPSLIEAATRQAYGKGESLSQFVSRAIQNQLHAS